MKYILSLSGGKDSLALFLRVIEEKYPLDFVVFYDTGMEFNAIYNNLISFLSSSGGVCPWGEDVDVSHVEEALKLKNTDVVNELGGLPPVKLHCSVLAEEAIHEAIADYYRKEGKLTEEEIKIKCNLKEHHCESCGI